MKCHYLGGRLQTVDAVKAMTGHIKIFPMFAADSIKFRTRETKRQLKRLNSIDAVDVVVQLMVRILMNSYMTTYILFMVRESPYVNFNVLTHLIHSSYHLRLL